MNTHFLFNDVFPKIEDNVIKYGTAAQTTDDNKIRRMRIVCRITKATDTHSEYVILLFHCNRGYANAPHCYVLSHIACHVVSCFFLTTKKTVNYFPAQRQLLGSYNRDEVCLLRGTN